MLQKPNFYKNQESFLCKLNFEFYKLINIDIIYFIYFIDYQLHIWLIFYTNII